MKEDIVLGIDPGLTGCLVSVNGSNSSLHDFIDTATSFNSLCVLNRAFCIKFAILEKVFLSPRDAEGDGKKLPNLEKLIRNSEMWRCFLEILDIDYALIAPSTWRKGLIPKNKKWTKSYSLKKARKLYPETIFERHDQAEAACMAYRAWKHVESGSTTRADIS